MVTEKDIMNMGRKIKRCKNIKTLERYNATMEQWITELQADLTRTQADILALEEKIKLEEEAKEAENKRDQDPDTGKFIPAPLPRIGAGEHQGARTDLGDPKSPMLESKKIAVKIVEQMIPLEEKIKMEEEAKAHQANPIHDPDTGRFAPVPAQKSGAGDTSKEQAKRIAEKAGPRKCYSYFEFERFHLRRSRA